MKSAVATLGFPPPQSMGIHPAQPALPWQFPALAHGRGSGVRGDLAMGTGRLFGAVAGACCGSDHHYDAGDGKAATLGQPRGVAVDSTGNVYIATGEYSGNDNYVLKRDTLGVLTTVAGDGSRNSSGDGGLATAAQLAPEKLEVDAADNLYIAEHYHNRIRRIDAQSGVITTAAGDGTSNQVQSVSSPMGLALDAAGFGYVPTYGHQKVLKVNGDV